MEALLYLGKMLLCSTLMWGYYQLFLKEKTFHHYNRFFLLATILVSIFLPLLKIEYFTIDTDSRLFWLMQMMQVSNGGQVAESIDWKLIIFYALLVVSLVLAIRLLIGIIKIQHMKSQYKSEEWEGIHFYLTDLHNAPFSFFRNLFWKSSIEINSPLGKQILKHEMVHIEQKHSWDKLIVEFSQALFWFNPVFYWIKKELFLIHEYLADKKAVQHNDTRAFAEMLLASNFSGTHLPATSPFLSSNLKKRLQMLTKPQKTKFSYIRRVMALPVLFAISFAYLVHAKNQEIKQLNKEISQTVATVQMTQTTTVDTLKEKPPIVTTEAPKPFQGYENALKYANDNAIYKINGKAVTKAEFTEYRNQNPNSKYAYANTNNSAENIAIFDAYDLNTKIDYDLTNAPLQKGEKRTYFLKDTDFVKDDALANENPNDKPIEVKKFYLNGKQVDLDNLTPEEQAVIDKLPKKYIIVKSSKAADAVDAKKLEGTTIQWEEKSKPLNFVKSNDEALAELRRSLQAKGYKDSEIKKILEGYATTLRKVNPNRPFSTGWNSVVFVEPSGNKIMPPISRGTARSITSSVTTTTTTDKNGTTTITTTDGKKPSYAVTGYTYTFSDNADADVRLLKGKNPSLIIRGLDGSNVKLYVNGKLSNRDSLNTINPNRIQSVNVNKDQNSGEIRIKLKS